MRRLAATASAFFLAQAALAADGPPEFDVGSLISRYAATQSFLSGGDAEREGLEAELARIPGAADNAVELGADLDGDGDPDIIHIRLEVAEVQEEVYPGEFVTFWVFAPLGRATGTAARAPSPTIRVEEGDRVVVTLYNTHYFPHTIHFHGTQQPNAMDGVPDMTQKEIAPGESFTYDFIAKVPGTYYYHCHVQEQVHIPMGLAGMFIVEPNRPRNHFAHLIPGGGRIAPMAKATRERYQNEYALVFTDHDDRLHRIPAAYASLTEIERRMHREYESTQRQPNIFLLNGRAFPFTLRDTPILVKPGETTRLRVLNAGDHTVYLHTHGHHPTLTHLDGYPVPQGLQVTRDTFEIGPSQRIDLVLYTVDDGYHAAGPGVWMVHDHAPSASSNKGINPGGSHTAIVYEGFSTVAMDHARHTAAYYQGRQPVFDPGIFRATRENYATLPTTPPAGGAFGYPTRREETALPRLDMIDAELHREVAGSCKTDKRGRERIHVKAGRALARPGEAYGFEPREIRLPRCVEVELTLENLDGVRHDLMIPGLNPMFTLNFIGPGRQSASFVTPDEDITLYFHCHVPIHDKAGMNGRIVIGKGGEPVRLAQAATAKTVDGVAVVIAVVPRMGRLIVAHEEIKGFMAAMEMSYPVAEPALLEGVNPGDKIAFTIDTSASRITAVVVTEKAR
jgi:FtsP/CotA-like multicopper oxidase with cupredoxin domain/Cu/Ag efflux protein CusF